jgi:hypothetical protein
VPFGHGELGVIVDVCANVVAGRKGLELAPAKARHTFAPFIMDAIADELARSLVDRLQT